VVIHINTENTNINIDNLTNAYECVREKKLEPYASDDKISILSTDLNKNWQEIILK